jgi:gliding motility-associated-like protein
MKNSYFFIIITLLLSQLSLAQLSVTAVATDENCPGTGSLALSVQNANPSAPVNYKVYLLPETNIPFWNSTNPNVPSLQDGDYLIIASQVVNGTYTSAQTTATIGSNYQPLAFSINSINAVCGNDGSMIIDVTSGTPATYELMSGPATAGPQASNVFNGIPAGTYQVRVTDVCGNGYISTQTFYVEQPVLAITGPTFSGSLVSCDQVAAGFTVNVEGTALGIVYPLAVKYTVHPPSGAAVVYNHAVASGPANGLVLTQNIPYYTQQYSIDVEVTDPCGDTYVLNNSTINQPMTAVASIVPVLCGENTLAITPTNHMPPYSLTFTASPAGFNPSATNGDYPGPYTAGQVTFGNVSNPVPLGNYTFQITDACGRTATGQITVIEPVIPEPTVATSNHDCINFLGDAQIGISNHPLLTAVMVSAPASYSQSMPYDVSDMINDEGTLGIDGLPQGDYVFDLTDVCGNSYSSIAAVVPEYSLQEPQYVVRPDCTIGMGTMRVTDDVTSIIITAAPTSFPFPLPYDASANIDEGTVTMDGLPAGIYSFTTSTVCAQNIAATVEMPGLEVTESSIELAGNCINFDLEINYTSTADGLTDFWLQSYNDELDAWVNPETGAVYTEGTNFSSVNAIQLSNHTINADLPYIGEFRVIKSQKAYASSSTGTNVKYCNEEFYTFEFYNELAIQGIYNLTCVGEVIDIMVDAVGVSPLQYEIISKNGDTSFNINNGPNNTFLGLEGATYVVRVTDPCGGFRSEQFNVSELPPLVSATTPPDLGFCDINGEGSGTFDLSVQDDVIIGDLDPEIVTITYHSSVEEASMDINPLPTTITSGTAEIFARVEWNVNTLCYGLASFTLNVAPPAELVMEDKWAFCPGQSVTVTADPGYVSYLWSTGATTPSIEVSEAGEYTVTVVSATTCEISNTITVVPATPPTIDRVDVNDWTDDQNTVTVIMEPTADMALYEFSLDGVTFQDSNVFTDVPAGQYNVIVRDRFGCGGGDSKEIHLLAYPKFFTPNGDGVHDTWRIEYAVLEPDMMVYIYDRYGKPITEFGSTSDGWDGTHKGQVLPATDYWFVVKRQDGREMRGHFAMMR